MHAERTLRCDEVVLAARRVVAPIRLVRGVDRLLGTALYCEGGARGEWGAAQQRGGKRLVEGRMAGRGPLGGGLARRRGGSRGRRGWPPCV